MAREQGKSSKYPRHVRTSTQRPSSVYARLVDHYAVHRQSGDKPSKHAVAALDDGERLIEVFRGDPAERQRSTSPGRVGPVYALKDGGTPATPTGRVFIRLREGLPVDARLKEINHAGYDVAERIGYAPNAAWLRARTGEIADALEGIEALENIADIENVEPQMLMHRASR
jgi:hypothetical protein